MTSICRRRSKATDYIAPTAPSHVFSQGRQMWFLRQSARTSAFHQASHHICCHGSYSLHRRRKPSAPYFQSPPQAQSPPKQQTSPRARHSSTRTASSKITRRRPRDLDRPHLLPLRRQSAHSLHVQNRMRRRRDQSLSASRRWQRKQVCEYPARE